MRRRDIEQAVSVRDNEALTQQKTFLEKCLRQSACHEKTFKNLPSKFSSVFQFHVSLIVEFIQLLKISREAHSELLFSFNYLDSV